jgi:hypothetical protein
VTGAGTAFAFIPVSIAALAGIKEHEAGLAAGLLNTSQQLGGAIGVAIASTVVATQLKTLPTAGHDQAAALTGGLGWAMAECAAIGLSGVLVTFALVRKSEIADAVPSAGLAKPEPALVAAD